MSKDIRSFFTVKKPTGSQSQTSNTQKASKRLDQRKRAAIVIDSSSDEEGGSIAVKRSKSVNEKNTSSINKNENKKIISPYFPAAKVSASDIFGARPIKRDNSRNIIKKVAAKVTEFHIDEDFESELLQLDDLIPDLEKKLEDNTNSTKNISLLKSDKVEHCTSTTDNEKAKYTNDNHHNDGSWKKIKLDQFNSLLKEEKNTKSQESIPTSLKKIKVDIKSESPKKESPKKQYSKKESPKKQYSKKESPKKQSSKKESPKKFSPSRITLDKGSPKKNVPLQISKISPNKQLSKEAETRSHGKNHTKVRNEPKQDDCSSATIPLPRKHDNTSKGIKINLVAAEEEKSFVTPCNLWVERYKPTSTKQIIGQQGEKSCVNKLITWLKNWHHNHSGKKKLVKPSPWAKNDDGAYYKTALLSGSPGVGKTTTAHLVARELGFDVVEFNASDTRSKKLLHEEVSELLSTNSLSPFFTGKDGQVTKKHVLLMDEVDGMAGNEDRGGVQELIQLIKQSRVPIICMCNDRNHPKIRSLANYCFDLRFSKPRVEQIRGAMMSMCFKEKMKLSADVMTEIITSANQDIRLIINHLSLLATAKSNLANSTKHIKMGPWDVARKIFSEEEHKSMSIYDKSDLFFHDYSLTPLFVQENYLNAVPHNKEAKSRIRKMELFASAARSLSFGDLVEKRIRSSNAWGLLPVQAIFSSVAPGEILEGHIGGQINFPAWFGKNSRQTKLNRLLQELTVHSRLKISGNKEAMNLDYLMPLEKSIVSPLVSRGSDGIHQALSVLTEYCLVREDLESMSELSSWPNTKNAFSEVESKVKAAFTRAYNKTSTPTPYAAVPIKKGSKSSVGDTEATAEEEDGSEDLEEEEEDTPEVDAMIVIKKKPSTKKVDKDEVPSTSKKNKNPKRGRKKL